jgi:phosphohistidine phosphatase
MNHIKDLVLWRHADAELPILGQADDSRKLTAKGLSQAADMAGWLNKHLPKNALVLTSPAVRAMQTVKPLKRSAHLLTLLSPEAHWQEIADYIQQSRSSCMLLVGHQPWIGDLIAQLIGVHHDGVSVKKGAVWWLRLNVVDCQYQVYTVQTPQLLN